MKKIVSKVKSVYASFMVTLMALSSSLTLMCSPACAADTSKLDGFIDFAADWLIKIGGVVAMVGGVMFALSWQRDDAEGKSRAMMTVMAGFMLVAVAVGKDMFF